MTMTASQLSGTDVAIVGIAGRYSRAQSPHELWDALVAGRELNYDGVPVAGPGRVTRYSQITDVEYFDHEFFGFTPYEAAMTDPQHRLLLECAYRALEDAGYADGQPRRFGVFASASISTYLLNNIVASGRYQHGAANFTAHIGNDKDMLASRVAYKLNLTGPALTIQTACSSSLVALHTATMSLLSRDCDGAVVAGASVTVPQDAGYRYEEGGILSRDGYCRPFDASSSGTVKGNGCSVVVLKRAADAVRDGDRIYALIRGTAVNNDGSAKIGYTAPSVTGQVDVIENCLAFADLDPEDIDCIEAHGTGTQLGDPIELAALAQVFGRPGRRLPLGSVKANVGHLDAAAGVTGVVKAVFMLRTGMVPGNIHLTDLNPKIDNTADVFAFPRHAENRPLRTVGVSSFGIGGTNAHAILARAPEPDGGVPGGGLPLYLLPLSYPRGDAGYRDRLRDSLGDGSAVRDVAYTLSTGRRWVPGCRYAAVAGAAELTAALSGGPDPVPLIATDLPGLLEALRETGFRALADTVPAYSACLAAVRRDGGLSPTDPDGYPAALLLLLKRLSAIEWADAGAFPSPRAAAESAYRRAGEPAPDPGRPRPDAATLARGRDALRAVYGFLATVGARRQLDLRALYAGLRPQRLSLPGVPMDRSRHWIDPLDAPQPELAEPQPETTAPAAGTAPADLVGEVARLVADGVGLPEVQASDNFSDIGGDSLLAISVVGDLNDRFGTALTLDEFMGCPTIGDIAELLRGRLPGAPAPEESAAEESVPAPSFVKVVRDAGGPTVFAVHPAGGTTFCYQVLNRVLSAPCTIVGLDLPERYAELDSMPKLARFFANAIDQMQPRDPVALCGYSFGGNLAVEIGKALIEDGRTVGPLFLIDALPPQTYTGAVLRPGEERRILPTVVQAYLQGRGRADAGTPDDPDDPVAASAAALGLSAAETARFTDAWLYHYRLLCQPPAPGAFPGSAVALRSAEGISGALADLLGVRAAPMELWRRRFTGPVEIVTVAGDHLSCLADAHSVKAVGVEFERWLTRFADGGRHDG
jgi:3-oxoacyl-(acyl-carrier-protein) synthase/thioesterase domain-containing protein/acyl carrier protein